MKRYKNNYLEILSDLEINQLNKNNIDEDFIINIENKVINLEIEDMPNYIVERFQLTEVRSILIRHSLDENIKYGTIHFLRVIDLNSSLLNFTIDLSKVRFEVLVEEFAIKVFIKKK